MSHRPRPAARVAASAGALAASVLLAACGYGGSSSSALRQWVSQNSFLSNERQVLADAHSLHLAVEKGSAIQLRTVCGGLSSDAGTLYGTLPTPNHPLTDELGASMVDFFHAAESCAVAPSTGGRATTRALSDLRRGMTELASARRTLASFGIRSPEPPRG
ncbi:MAG TPA: hypothetical protein VFN50_10210 [Acidimicrobiales bacterium]|nr:hypothetical protein [Acidimicrobiales bacterium]